MTLSIGLLITNIFISVAVIASILYFYKKQNEKDTSTSLIPKLDSLESFNERLERTFRDENAQLREQNQTQGKALREELNTTVRGFGDSLEQRFDNTGKRLDERLGQFSTEQSQSFKTLRDEVSTNLNRVGTDLRENSKDLSENLDFPAFTRHFLASKNNLLHT